MKVRYIRESSDYLERNKIYTIRKEFGFSYSLEEFEPDLTWAKSWFEPVKDFQPFKVMYVGDTIYFYVNKYQIYTVIEEDDDHFLLKESIPDIRYNKKDFIMIKHFQPFKVKCINDANSNSELYIGGTYTVIAEEESKYVIITNKHRYRWNKERFERIDDFKPYKVVCINDVPFITMNKGEIYTVIKEEGYYLSFKETGGKFFYHKKYFKVIDKSESPIYDLLNEKILLNKQIDDDIKENSERIKKYEDIIDTLYSQNKKLELLKHNVKE